MLLEEYLLQGPNRFRQLAPCSGHTRKSYLLKNSNAVEKKHLVGGFNPFEKY